MKATMGYKVTENNDLEENNSEEPIEVSSSLNLELNWVAKIFLVTILYGLTKPFAVDTVRFVEKIF